MMKMALVSKMTVGDLYFLVPLSYNGVKMALGSKMAVGVLYCLVLLEVFKRLMNACMY